MSDFENNDNLLGDATDILDDVTKNEDVKVTTSSTNFNSNSNSNRGFVNKKGIIKQLKEGTAMPADVDKGNLDPYTRVLTIKEPGKGILIPENVSAKIRAISTHALEKGFKFRWDGNKNEPLSAFAHQIFGQKASVVFPWKGFSSTIDKPTLEQPTDSAYIYASFIDNMLTERYKFKSFKESADTIIKFRAATANVLLGVEMNAPVKFLLIYSEDGYEGAGDIDFNKVGYSLYTVMMARELSIPIFNLSKDDVVERVKSLIDTL